MNSTGKGAGAQRKSSPLGHIDYCELRLAKELKQKYTSLDHIGACRHVACEACGPRKSRWAPPRKHLGEIIGDNTWGLLLCWPKLAMHSDSVSQVVKFVQAAKTLAHELRSDQFGPIAVYAGATEYSPVGSSHFQPHLHFAFLFGTAGIAHLRGVVKRWIALGGIIWQGKFTRCPKAGETLATFMSYTSKHPLSHMNEIARRRMHDRVLNSAEMVLQATAHVQFIGGLECRGRRKKKLRAYAREKIKTQNVGQVVDNPDKEYAAIETKLKCVAHIELCPHCNAYGNDIAPTSSSPAGTPRLRCKKCKKRWTERPVYSDEINRRRLKSRKTKIRRMRAQGISVMSIAKKVGLTQQGVYNILKAAG